MGRSEVLVRECSAIITLMHCNYITGDINHIEVLVDSVSIVNQFKESARLYYKALRRLVSGLQESAQYFAVLNDAEWRTDIGIVGESGGQASRLKSGRYVFDKKKPLRHKQLNQFQLQARLCGFHSMSNLKFKDD